MDGNESIVTVQASLFDTLRMVRPDSSEYWSARDLMPALGYQRWENAQAAITRAIEACENSRIPSGPHFRATTKKVNLGGKAARDVLDYHLTRYGAYLTAMNSDPTKAQVALAQTYFAVQTRHAEQTQAASLALPDDPILAQLEMLRQVRVGQLQLEHRTQAIEERLDSAPITSEKVGRIHRLGQQLGQLMGDYSRAWRLFKDRFGLASYRDLPSNRFDEAVRFLQLQIASYTGQPNLLDGDT